MDRKQASKLGSDANSLRMKIIREQRESEYYKSPKLCVVCNKVIPYDKARRGRTSCGYDCSRKRIYNEANKYSTTDDIIKELCNTSISMAEAARKANIEKGAFIEITKRLGCYKPNQGLKGTKKKSSQIFYNINDILLGKHPHLSANHVKKRLFKEGLKKEVCEGCELKDWRSKKISLELHHKDGDKHNHKFENLEILCPNCHSQTDNYGSKNKFCANAGMNTETT